MGIGRMSLLLGWYSAVPDLRTLIHAIFYIDVGLLIFNILPIYPLDGGQILRALLWFLVGRARSFDGSDPPRVRRHRRILRLRIMVARQLARRNRRLHAHELLERDATRARPVAIRKVAAQIRIRLSCMQSQPADRRLLEMRKVWPGIR
jgi:hypothetical protein